MRPGEKQVWLEHPQRLRLFLAYQLEWFILWWGPSIVGFDTLLERQVIGTHAFIRLIYYVRLIPYTLYSFLNNYLSGLIILHPNPGQTLVTTGRFDISHYWLFWTLTGVVGYALYVFVVDIVIGVVIHKFFSWLYGGLLATKGSVPTSNNSSPTSPPIPPAAPTAPETTPDEPVQVSKGFSWGWIVWLAVFLLLALLPFVR